MSFASTYLYRMTSNCWLAWSSLNPYSAALSFPLFLAMILALAAAGILLDIWTAWSWLVRAQ